MLQVKLLIRKLNDVISHYHLFGNSQQLKEIFANEILITIKRMITRRDRKNVQKEQVLL